MRAWAPAPFPSGVTGGFGDVSPVSPSPKQAGRGRGESGFYQRSIEETEGGAFGRGGLREIHRSQSWDDRCVGGQGFGGRGADVVGPACLFPTLTPSFSHRGDRRFEKPIRREGGTCGAEDIPPSRRLQAPRPPSRPQRGGPAGAEGEAAVPAKQGGGWVDGRSLSQPGPRLRRGLPPPAKTLPARIATIGVHCARSTRRRKRAAAVAVWEPGREEAGGRAGGPGEKVSAGGRPAQVSCLWAWLQRERAGGGPSD